MTMMILKSALVLSTLCTMNAAPVQECGKGGRGNGVRIQQRLQDGTCDGSGNGICDGTGRRDGTCGNGVRRENCANVCDNTGNSTCVAQGRRNRGNRLD